MNQFSSNFARKFIVDDSVDSRNCSAVLHQEQAPGTKNFLYAID